MLLATTPHPLRSMHVAMLASPNLAGSRRAADESRAAPASTTQRRNIVPFDKYDIDHVKEQEL
jgi:hypothetical protein